MRFFYLSIFYILWSSSSWAHPVSFKTSKGVMGYHSPFLSHNQLNYSWEYWFATGAHHIRRPDLENSHATFASTNFLLKRWNGSGLQANIYLTLGAGASELNQESKFAGLSALQFDIEDRNYYFLAKHTEVINEDNSDFRQTVVRAGVAPYVVNYDGIHSWLILEWQGSQFGNGDDLDDLTPFLRVFYKNLLFEIGQSFDGATKFNYIAHF